MNKPEHILPIGTVVLTETGEVPLMIISRASLYDDNGEVGYFDYAAVPYPKVMKERRMLLRQESKKLVKQLKMYQMP